MCRHASFDWAQRGCAWEFAKEALFLARFDPSVAFSAIMRSGNNWEPAHMQLMITSAAFLVGERGVNTPDQKLAAVCDSLKNPERTYCIKGVENGLLFNGRPGGREVERSARFCVSDGFSPKETAACEEVLVQYMTGAYGEEGRTSACEALIALDPGAIGCAEHQRQF